ncbi:MAG: metallophosphoesterase [Myxococcota bacterium]
MHRILPLLLLALAACQPSAPLVPTDVPDRRSPPPKALQDIEGPLPSEAAEASTSPNVVTDTIETEGEPETPPPARPPATQPPATVLPPVGRLVALGDVHGDIEALRSALRIALVIDETNHWIGGTTTVVQVGDQLDRGEDERAILHWLEQLAEEARLAGGAIYPLLGNHETMNVKLDLRYVTEGGYADFADVPWDPEDPLFAEFPEAERGRVAAFRAGGPYAVLLARHPIALIVGDTVFVHGGLLPEHAAYGLDAINQETREWMLGNAPRPSVLSGDASPVWSRHYSDAPDDADCALLTETLTALNASRMVVAHTVHKEGITSACQEQVWRVDVGLASYYGGPTQVLVIEGETLTVLP